MANINNIDNIKAKVKKIDVINAGVSSVIQRVYPETEEITITPKTETQVLEPTTGKLIDKVHVDKVTASIDPDIKAENIKVGANILGIDGAYEGVDTSDATATAGDLLKDKTAYVNGEKIVGTIQEYDGSFTGGGSSVNEWEAIFTSSIDETLGANVTKLPEGITKIGKYAFYECDYLALTELPETITEIREHAFDSCENLALTKLPEGITKLTTSVFSSCTNLAITKLPEGMTSIGQYSLNACRNIKLTELPDNLIEIKSAAFRYCDKLAITKLPKGMTKLESSTFLGCISLTELDITSENFSSIASQCFYECTNLTKIIIRADNVTLNNISAFRKTPIENGTGYIYVPDDTVETYKTATNWSTYANQIKGISEL